MALFSFRRDQSAATAHPDAEIRAGIAAFLDGYSIEVMPRTAAKIADFRPLLPKGTRVYIAHIEGTPIKDMVATARRLADEGFAVMPHFPARLIHDRATLADWISRYQTEAGVTQALLLGGGVASPAGEFDSSMQLIETGLFRDFDRLHLAGHPEGNRDIDRDGSDARVMQALRWKQEFSTRSDARMAIVTQFCFDAKPVIAWADRLAQAGITIPIHIGVAGPAKLQTLIKFALSCGVGPSVKVLQKRALDVGKLLLPYTPDDFIADLSMHKMKNPSFNIESVHFFPLGGITPATEWASRNATVTAASERS